MAKPVEITIKVNASALCPLSALDDEVLAANNDMSDDNNGCSPGGRKNKDFQSVVYVGKTVTWIPVVKGANPQDRYTVKIKEIKFKSGTNIFGYDPLTPVAGGVTAQVLPDSKLNNTLYEYTIHVEVYDDGTLCHEYPVDPKLQANT